MSNCWAGILFKQYFEYIKCKFYNLYYIAQPSKSSTNIDQTQKVLSEIIANFTYRRRNSRPSWKIDSDSSMVLGSISIFSNNMNQPDVQPGWQQREMKFNLVHPVGMLSHLITKCQETARFFDVQHETGQMEPEMAHWGQGTRTGDRGQAILSTGGSWCVRRAYFVQTNVSTNSLNVENLLYDKKH